MAKNIIEPHPRDKLMHRLATVENWSLERIGQFFGGMTKQNVSIRIHGLQDHPLDPFRSKRPSIEKLILVCDNSFSMKDSAEKLGIGDVLLRRTLDQLELLQKYKAFWRMRRIERGKHLIRRKLIRIMRLVAHNLGHTPSIDELNDFARRSLGRIPFHSCWVTAFGSFRNGQIAAGLIPNNRGGGKYYKKAS